MKKNAELFFTFLKIPLDYLTLLAAGILAYFLRYEQSIQEIRPIIFDLTFDKYFIFTVVVSASWLIFFAWAGLYSFKRRKITDELAKIILACSTGMTAVIIYMFFVREMFSSRFILLIAWLLSIFMIIII